MDKLVFPPSGGMFLNPEDLEFQFSAYEAGIHAVVRAIATEFDGNLFLWGMEVEAVNASQGLYKITEGYCLINHELRYFPETPITLDNPAYISGYGVVVDNSVDPNGLESLANGQTVNTYHVRRAKLWTVEAQYMPFNGANRFSTALKTSADAAPELYTRNIRPENNWTLPANDERLRFFRKGGTVTLTGKILVGDLDNTGYTLIGTLPLSNQPRRHQAIITPIFPNGAAILEVKINGDIYVKNLIGTVADNQGGVLHVNDLTFDRL
jgi:hypothetical protein